MIVPGTFKEALADVGINRKDLLVVIDQEVLHGYPKQPGKG